MPSEPRTIRLARLATGAILLWLTACIAFSLLFVIIHPFMSLMVLVISIRMGFPWAGGQCVLYSLVMEFGVWRVVGINGAAILTSSLLGLACGLSVFFLFAGEVLVPLMFAGFVAGLTTGLILYQWKKRALVGPTSPPAPGAIL